MHDHSSAVKTGVKRLTFRRHKEVCSVRGQKTKVANSQSRSDRLTFISFKREVQSELNQLA